jgi:hypothetical protein
VGGSLMWFGQIFHEQRYDEMVTGWLCRLMFLTCGAQVGRLVVEEVIPAEGEEVHVRQKKKQNFVTDLAA